MSWIPLHAHSQYSILEASASISGLVQKAVQYKLPALALTDFNLFGAVDFFHECQAHNVRPILGCELYVAPRSRFEKQKVFGEPHGFPIVLLVKDREGYRNLCQLTSKAYLEGFYYTPRIDRELLAEYCKGLICLSGTLSGRCAHWILQNEEEKLREEVDWYRTHFGKNFYFELQRHAMTEDEMRKDEMEKEPWLLQMAQGILRNQEIVHQRLLQCAKEAEIGYVATNDTRYLEREDWLAHEILLNIQSGEPIEIWERDSLGRPKTRSKNPKRKVMPTHLLHFRSPEEMKRLFSDLPEALANTVRIAEECRFAFDDKSKYYPVFVPPSLEGKIYSEKERAKQANAYLRSLCEEAIPQRYKEEELKWVREKYPEQEPLRLVRERLEYELTVILSKGMGDYLLVVWDFIAWAKRKHIPVGPGRGSGAGSIVLYLLGITDIEPLRFHLFFERFVNPERISDPDIDVDICMERRQEVIEYTVQKYGKDKVAQIITFGTSRAKMAIRDVGRVLNVPLAKVNEIAKLVPEDPQMTLEKACEMNPEFMRLIEEDKEAARLVELAKVLEGSIRSTGIHAAGTIVCGEPITDHVPVCAAKDAEMIVTQFSMKPLEALGMLKIDFLGLKTLTAIHACVQALKKKLGLEIDWARLPLDDTKTFFLMNQGKVLGVFQLESSRGMQELVQQLHVDRFEEVIAVVALYRPGPMGLIPSFIERKHGREEIESDHPLMSGILEETYGIMVYQEQVMQIANVLAGYSLGEGDLLRRAMGKKDHKEMARQKSKFISGAMKKGIEEALARRIFDKIEKFASYGFNKSHAAAYGYLCYVTAYLKAHYPGEWMAALMTTEHADSSKIALLIREAKSLGVHVLPPHINESDVAFVATPQGIRFSMTGIKGVGEGVVASIVHERTAHGLFASLFDFVRRMDTRKIGKKTIALLIEAGAFDFTSYKRQALLMGLENIFSVCAEEQKEREKGIQSLFGPPEEPPLPTQVEEVPKQVQLQRECELLGVYLKEHPLDSYRTKIEELGCASSLEEIKALEDGRIITMAGIVEKITVKLSQKTQKKFAIVTLGDGVASVELFLWSDVYEEKATLLQQNQLLVCTAIKESGEETLRLRGKWVCDLVQAHKEGVERAYAEAQKQQKSLLRKEKREEPPKEWLHITLDVSEMRASHVLHLKALLRARPGAHSIRISFMQGETLLKHLDVEYPWGVEKSPLFEGELRNISSVKGVAWKIDPLRN